MKRHPSNSELLRDLLKVDKLQADVGTLVVTPEFEAQRERIRTAPHRMRQLWERYQRANTSMFAIFQMIGKGYSEHRKSRPTRYSNEIERWMNDLSNVEMLTFSLRFFVLVACAELEHFLRSITTAKLGPVDIQRILGDRRSPADVRKKLTRLTTSDAKRFLADWIKPSAGSSVPWRRRVELVFNTRIPTPVARALRLLIKWRHEFSHRGNPPLKVDWGTHQADVIEATLTWYLAAISLSDQLCFEWLSK